jgi:hypothetical protein
MSTLLPNVFVVRGVQFTTVPGKWEILNSSPYGVRDSVAATADGSNLLIIHQPADILNTGIGIEQRLNKNQAFQATWDTGSWMDACMYNYLKQLYETNTPFWLQFDDEMSRLANPVLFNNPSSDLQTFFTPTYPAFPYGFTPTNVAFHLESMVYDTTKFFINNVSGVGALTLLYSPEYGIIKTSAPLSVGGQLSGLYTWRLYCRISQLNLHGFNLGDHVYAGTVIFSQIKFPVLDPDYYNITLPGQNNNVWEY